MRMWTWASSRFRTQFTNPISVRRKSKSHPRSKLGQSKKTRTAESWTLLVESVAACAPREMAMSGRPRQSPKHTRVGLTSPSWLRVRALAAASRQRNSPRDSPGVNIAPARAVATTDRYDVQGTGGTHEVDRHRGRGAAGRTDARHLGRVASPQGAQRLPPGDLPPVAGDTVALAHRLRRHAVLARRPPSDRAIAGPGRARGVAGD